MQNVNEIKDSEEKCVNEKDGIEVAEIDEEEAFIRSVMESLKGTEIEIVEKKEEKPVHKKLDIR